MDLTMSTTAYFAFFVLGCDFLVAVLFHWLYGEKRSGRFARWATRTQAMSAQPRYNTASASKKPALPLAGKSQITCSPQASYLSDRDARLHRLERLAHQRIAASFSRSRA